MAKPVLAQAGFEGDELNIGLGVSYAESGGYADAVGDTTLISDKWGPSIGLFQIRSLRRPQDYAGTPDALRIADKLRNPLYNAQTALALRQWLGWDLWSVYRHGTWVPHVGRDYPILTGHERAHLWNI